METYIETFALLFLGDAQPDRPVDHLQDDDAAHAAHDERRRHSGILDPDDRISPTDFLDVEVSGEDRADYTGRNASRLTTQASRENRRCASGKSTPIANP